jgi:hypothetical protein
MKFSIVSVQSSGVVLHDGLEKHLGQSVELGLLTSPRSALISGEICMSLKTPSLGRNRYSRVSSP